MTYDMFQAIKGLALSFFEFLWQAWNYFYTF